MMRLRPCLITLLLALPAVADPVLPALFSDHMVLQRGRNVPVWGWADPGEEIAVSLRSERRTAVAGPDGRWRVTLPAMTEGGPFRLTVAGRKTIALNDVLVGEVWVASGQSNMNFGLSRARTAAADLPKADYPEMRLFTVPLKSALEPQRDTPGAAWQVCTPETARTFSAVAYYFGRELHEKLGVPVGIIHTSWSGTTAELWTDPASLRGDEDFAPILRRWQESPGEVKELAGNPRPFQLEFDNFELVRNDAGAPMPLGDFDAGTARIATGGGWTTDSGRNATFDLIQPGRDGQGFAARFAGTLDAAAGASLRATLKPHRVPVDLSAFAGLRFHCRGNAPFNVRFFEPAITDSDNYTAGPFPAMDSWQSVTIRFKDLKQAGWGVKNPFTPNAITGFAIDALRSARAVMQPPSALFNGMIAPLAPYAMRGAIWYQGEGNAGRAYQYRKLLPAMIRGWRTAWGQGDFPFLVVQLPNFGGRPEQPGESGWAELREAQLLSLRTPNTGMAVTIDLGEPGNVHPAEKAEVGRRLALWALGTTYERPLVYSGPLYESASVEANRVRVRFRHAGSGLVARGGGRLTGFAIAGADRKFHWADAAIEGESVVVSSADVPAPVAVRYAWAGDPDCSLMNREGLPASPFRTDEWPGVTAGQK